MGNKPGNKRRAAVGYVYNVFNEVSYYPRSSDIGERVNILITEICKISNVIKLTVSTDESESYVYLGADKVKTILSHTRYKAVLDSLIRRKILSRPRSVNRFGDPIYSFAPVYYTPIQEGVPIRNLKVRNSIRRYLGIQEERISPDVNKWILPALISTEVKISEAEFFEDLAVKYERYVGGKNLKGEKPRSLESYRRDIRQTYLSILEYQQLGKIARGKYIREDHFSGRVYNIATGVPRWVRGHFRIGGETVSEVDMRSFHAVLLWMIVPRTDFARFLWDVTSQGRDIYDAYGERLGIIDRKAVKYRFLRSLYSRPSSRYSQEFRSIFPEAGRILDDIKSTPDPRNPSGEKNGHHTNLAFKLLNLEVKLFRRVWEALYIEGIPFLSIHDGILIPTSRATQARDIMVGVLRQSIPIVESKFIFY